MDTAEALHCYNLVFTAMNAERYNKIYGLTKILGNINNV